MRGLLLAGLCIASMTSGIAASAAELMQTPVFTAGEEGYDTYRIPAVVCTPAGTLLAFCEGRKDNRRDHGDIDLVLKRSEDNGETWGPLELVYEEGGTAKITIGNPCPVVDQDTGTIWLPFCRDNDDVLVTKSTDDGKTWAEPVDVTDSVKPEGWTWYATGPGVGIQLERGPHAGRLVIPCDHREDEDDRWMKKSHCFYSDDGGETWELGDSVAKYTDECQAVQLVDGRVLINMRNYWEREGGKPELGGMRALAWSDDGAATWSDLEFDDELPEPVCQASFLRYTTEAEHDANRVLFSNPASSEKRVKMTVRMSRDEGETWPVARTLYKGPSAYSCLVVLPDLRMGCLYERGARHSYETITFACFDREWLEAAE
ncbi:MAG: sialidase family protein [Candidatus Hydrogenedentota bacterium]